MSTTRSTLIDNVKHGFTCDIHNQWPCQRQLRGVVGWQSWRSNDDPDRRLSVTLKINATVKERITATSIDRTSTFKVDKDHQIDESNEKQQ